MVVVSLVPATAGERRGDRVMADWVEMSHLPDNRRVGVEAKFRPDPVRVGASGIELARIGAVVHKGAPAGRDPGLGIERLDAPRAADQTVVQARRRQVHAPQYPRLEVVGPRN